MAREIGIRELKIHASEILRNLRRRKTRYIITYRGRPVGLLTPFEETPAKASLPAAEAWNELARLGEQIGKGWKSPLSSAELLSQMRR